MVTGDLTYNIPVFEVPSPEGNFPVSLTYRAGIGMEQEASWVGLGWSMTPGAISRSVSQFPDDFSGEAIETNVQDNGGSSYSINVLGFYTKNVDSETGGNKRKLYLS